MSVQTGGLLECIDGAEYDVLSVDQKDLVKILLSCGDLDLSVGSKALGYIESVFPVGTVTRIAIASRFAV